LRPAAAGRLPSLVSYKTPLKSDIIFIHTHLQSRSSFEEYVKEEEKKGIMIIEVKTNPPDMPSLQDIRIFLGLFLAGSQVRTFVTVPIAPNGEVTGYIFMRAGRELTKLAKSKSIIGKRMHDKALYMGDYGLRLSNHKEANYNMVLQDLQNLGLRIRFVPMPGYRSVEDAFVKTG